MITSCVILAKERFVNLTVLQLDGIQDILHDFNHCSTALIARLDYVQKALPLEYPAHTTVETCQEIPRLPNQSVWDSLYFFGRKFKAQSLIIKTVLSSSFSSASILAWSWLADLRMWHFQDIMASWAVWNINNASSFAS